MRNRFWVSMVVLSAAALTISIGTSAQNNSKPTCPEVDWHKPRITQQNQKPAPRRNIAGSWRTAGGPDAGTQAGGVQLKPNNGKPGNARAYTPHPLEVHNPHKPPYRINTLPPTTHN